MDSLKEKLNLRCIQHFNVVLQNMKNNTAGKMTLLEAHETLADVWVVSLTLCNYIHKLTQVRLKYAFLDTFFIFRTQLLVISGREKQVFWLTPTCSVIVFRKAGT